MIGISGGTATWDWQLGQYAARINDVVTFYPTIEDLCAARPIEDSERADLEIYRLTCEANK